MKRIAVVDDHPIVRGTLSRVLSADAELQVIGEAGDGESGLKIALAEKPDLIILDLDLPRMDGLSLIRRVRSQDDKIRILVLSAKPEQIMASHTRIAGANGYVGKGREVGELLTAVKTVLFGYDCFPADLAGTSHDGGGLGRLSPREVEVLQYLARGVSNKEISVRLSVSDKTISTYKTRIQEKLGLSSLVALIEFASLHKLID
jgi:two-component system response regulator FimZ (fimbrial Z protein)